MRAGHLAALQGRHTEAVDHFQREIDFLVRTDHPLRYRILVELNVRLGASYPSSATGRRPRPSTRSRSKASSAASGSAPTTLHRYYAAAVHALRGDAEPALALLQRALVQQPEFTAARAAIEPEFDNLRQDTRFQRLLQEKGTG